MRQRGDGFQRCRPNQQQGAHAVSRDPLQLLLLPLQLQVRLAPPHPNRDHHKIIKAYTKLYGKEARTEDMESDGESSSSGAEDEEEEGEEEEQEGEE